MTLVEYHSRTFKFKRVALLICMDLYETYKLNNKMDKSLEYALKSLKLAVILKDEFN
jgi:hypothetical protein